MVLASWALVVKFVLVYIPVAFVLVIQVTRINYLRTAASVQMVRSEMVLLVT